jgi:hypothetical protein
MAADTSSAEAVATLVVGPAAAAMASSIAEPTPVKSVAAAESSGSCALTYVIG